MGGTPTQRYRANIADMLTGAVEMAPGVGEAVGVTDTRQAIRSGDYGTAAMLGGATALGMVPVIGDAASRAIREGLDMSQAARMQGTTEQAADTYYHGGRLTGPIKENEGLFDGIFLSPSEASARSHGGNLYEFEIPPDKIADSGDFIGYSNIPWEQQKAAIIRTNRFIDPDEPDFDLWYKAVVEDKAEKLDSDDLTRIFGREDWGENLWEAQRQRGRLAKELGYDAVKVSDEHGDSVLLVRDRPYKPAPLSR